MTVACGCGCGELVDPRGGRKYADGHRLRAHRARQKAAHASFWGRFDPRTNPRLLARQRRFRTT